MITGSKAFRAAALAALLLGLAACASQKEPAEAALAANATHAGALRASLAAHRALLRATTNFWETRWLEQRIAELSALLGEAP